MVQREEVSTWSPLRRPIAFLLYHTEEDLLPVHRLPWRCMIEFSDPPGASEIAGSWRPPRLEAADSKWPGKSPKRERASLFSRKFHLFIKTTATSSLATLAFYAGRWLFTGEILSEMGQRVNWCRVSWSGWLGHGPIVTPGTKYFAPLGTQTSGTWLKSNVVPSGMQRFS